MHETRLFWVVPGERFRQQCSCRQYFKIRWGFYTKVKVSWLRAFLWSMSQTSCDRGNSCRARTHEKNSGETVHRLGTLIHSIFWAQSGTSILLTVWKWSGESQYPVAWASGVSGGKGEKWKRKRERAEGKKRVTQMLLLEPSTPTQHDSIPSNQNHIRSLGCQLHLSKS